jgi:transmembrane sensor
MDEAIVELIIAEQTGVLSADQKAQLQSWRLENQSHEDEYHTTVKLWMDAGQVPYQSKNQKAQDWNVVSQAINTDQRSSVNWLTKIAAVIALLLAAGILIYQFYWSPYAGYTAYNGEAGIEELSLADGSIITLNKGSELWVSDNFGAIDRDIKLIGEAYFEVVKNDQLPFIITGKGSTTKVVGTTFNLLVEETSVELTVTEGLVSFGSSTKTIAVGVGQSATLITNGSPPMVSHNLNRLSWKTGVLRFDEATLTQVCKDIAKHYSINIEVAANATDLNFTSQYNEAPLEEVLNELELILALDIRLNNTTYQVNLK